MAKEIDLRNRTDTGDNEARPTEKGSGPAHATVDPTSFGGTSSITHTDSGRFDLDRERADDVALEVGEATDGQMGITNVGNNPPDDWAANTGETKTP